MKRISIAVLVGILVLGIVFLAGIATTAEKENKSIERNRNGAIMKLWIYGAKFYVEIFDSEQGRRTRLYCKKAELEIVIYEFTSHTLMVSGCTKIRRGKDYAERIREKEWLRVTSLGIVDYYLKFLSLLSNPNLQFPLPPFKGKITRQLLSVGYYLVGKNYLDLDIRLKLISNK